MTFETGASTHDLNSLILFTDNTEITARRRDEKFQSLWARFGDKPTLEECSYTLGTLFNLALRRYNLEAPKEERIYLTNPERIEFIKLYHQDLLNFIEEEKNN